MGELKTVPPFSYPPFLFVKLIICKEPSQMWVWYLSTVGCGRVLTYENDNIGSVAWEIPDK